MSAIEPFRIEVADAELDDLRERLRRTRWPDQPAGVGWDLGIPLDYVQDVCRYWAEHYDWRAREARLNRYEHHRTTIDGLGIHFLHAPSPEPGALPLVMTHGWPGSIVEFLDVIEPLRDPVAHGGRAEDAFHVVCPSLPGYGFSDRPAETGWGVERIGRAWTELMARLGYDRYGAQGGDWGSMVTTHVGLADPEHCAGIHLNMPVAVPGADQLGDLTPTEQQALADLANYDKVESGYSKQQSTRPQTLAYGLTDSPAGQAAWVLEKFWAWTDCGGHPENVIDRDRLLDNVMLYWLPATAGSSARLYWESFARGALGDERIEVPTGCSIFPKEIIRSSRRWAERRFNITYWNELDKGGHFAAFEQPELFVGELRAFFGGVR